MPPPVPARVSAVAVVHVWRHMPTCCAMRAARLGRHSWSQRSSRDRKGGRDLQIGQTTCTQRSGKRAQMRRRTWTDSAKCIPPVRQLSGKPLLQAVDDRECQAHTICKAGNGRKLQQDNVTIAFVSHGRCAHRNNTNHVPGALRPRMYCHRFVWLHRIQNQIPNATATVRRLPRRCVAI